MICTVQEMVCLLAMVFLKPFIMQQYSVSSFYPRAGCGKVRLHVVRFAVTKAMKVFAGCANRQGRNYLYVIKFSLKG